MRALIVLLLLGTLHAEELALKPAQLPEKCQCGGELKELHWVEQGTDQIDPHTILQCSVCGHEVRGT